MAQLISVRLSRVDAQPWGLRLQGGKDFGTPLVVQKVNMGSIADQAGLVVGDALIKVNNVDAFNLRHKDAQDLIVKSGNSFEITVQRGGGTWRPSVTPTGAIPSPTPNYGNHIQTVTKTSLAHKQQDVKHIGSGYNNAARPFGSQNGEQVKSIVNKQYNTPVGIYSEESIAETLSAQAEVLAGGVLGVNFKKNEKVYNSANSEVLKALQEAENDPAEPEDYTTPSPHHHHLHQQQPPHRAVTPVTKHVIAPVDRPAPPPTTGGLPTGQNICAECERLIVGVFVRIKDKNLHVDCFKCATCGTSLKNQGYFNLNNKLYCDIHAKMAAINNPPPGTEGFRPVPIQPNTKLSASTISAALNAHHHQNGSSQQNNLHSNLAGPKPFNYAAGPPAAAPKSPSSYPPPSQNSAPSWAQPKPQAYSLPQQPYIPTQQSYVPPPQQTYAAPVHTYSAPAPALNSYGQNYGSNTLPRSVGGNNAPAPPPLPASPPPSMSPAKDTYKRGHATELLEQSIQNLKANDKDEFRSNAGKIISFMLESRLNDGKLTDDSNKVQDLSKKPPYVSPIKSNVETTKHKLEFIPKPPLSPVPIKVIDFVDHYTSLPVLPIPPINRLPSPSPISPQPKYTTDLDADDDDIANFLPPPPPPPIVHTETVNFLTPLRSQSPPKSLSPISFNRSPQSSHLNSPSAYSKASLNGASNGSMPGASSPHENCIDAEKSKVVFRQKNNTSELTSAHARDRRSFIERDLLGNNNNRVTNTQTTTDIASDLSDGKHPVCCCCNTKITTGPFITALGKIWCPDHFVCVSQNCRRPLQDIGFVEEKGDLYCEYCFEKYLAPPCDKCNAKIKGDCLNAIGKHFHPECFTCAYCGKLFGNSPFFLEEGQAYCETDWNELFTTKCFACGFPVEAGDRWVEALSHNYHSQCFNCTMCKKNLEGQSFFAKGGRPYCKNHAR